MTVEPREGPEGSVFRFEGRRWRANRRVSVTFGVYCPPGSACIDIAYFARMRTNARGRFVFRLRAGEEQRGDEKRRIRAGGEPLFSQHGITRRPRYRVIHEGSSAEPSSLIVQRGLWATSHGWPSGSVNAAE